MLFNANQTIEQKRLIHSLLLPLAMAVIMFAIKLVEWLEHIKLTSLGIRPRTLEGFWGLFTSPFIHGDWVHLMSNLPSFTALFVGLRYFYKDVAWQVWLFIYLFSGLFVWLFGRDSWHIGASGLIYGMASFLFFSGLIRQYIPLLAISLTVVFLYGSMVWGIFPLSIHLPYSWEAHLGGTLSGIIMAVAMRNRGPQKPVKIWDDELDDSIDEDKYWEVNNEQTNLTIDRP